MRFFKSFKYASRGLVYCINNERNMRIHTVISFYVLAFSGFFNLSRTDYSILLLTIAAVLAAESVNTSIEELTDLSASTYNPMARISKDVAAGAVLVVSVFAVVVGVLILWQPIAFIRMFDYFRHNLCMLFLVVVMTVLAIIYIILGPKEIKNKFRKKKIGIKK